MRTTSRKFLAAAGLACLALVGANSILAASPAVISTFDSDLSSMPSGANPWHSWDTPAPTAITWDSAGTPGGSMHVYLDWSQGTAPWQWEDRKVQVDPWGLSTPPPEQMLNLANYDNLEFDLKVLTSVSQQGYSGFFGGVMPIVQTWAGWGDNPADIDQGYQMLGAFIFDASTTEDWMHFTFPTASWPWTLGRLTFILYNFGNLDSPTHTEVLIDNVQFTTIPEPGTFTLLGCGLAAWLYWRRPQR